MHALNIVSRCGSGVGADRILFSAWNLPHAAPILVSISSAVFSVILKMRPRILSPSLLALVPGNFVARGRVTEGA